jgi:hypothetical protein
LGLTSPSSQNSLDCSPDDGGWVEMHNLDLVYIQLQFRAKFAMGFLTVGPIVSSAFQFVWIFGLNIPRVNSEDWRT